MWNASVNVWSIHSDIGVINATPSIWLSIEKGQKSIFLNIDNKGTEPIVHIMMVCVSQPDLLNIDTKGTEQSVPTTEVCELQLMVLNKDTKAI